MKAKAAVLYEAGQPAVIEEITLEPPHQGEVLVRMEAAGVCHSDLHVRDGTLPEPMPIVLGHEGTGVVTEVGSAVTGLRPGDRVVLTLVPACGHCYFCQRGEPHMCLTSGAMAARGVLRDGTTRLRSRDRTLYHFNSVSCFSEYVVVPQEGAVKIPPDIPVEIAALLGCAVVTGVGAVERTAGVRPGESVAVVGCGGVGLNVIQAASLSGAYPIIAIDIRSDKIDLARTFGASHGINAREQDVVATVREIVDYGVDWAFEVLGHPRTIEQAWELIRPGGTVVVVGLSPKGSKVTLPAFDFISEKNIRGCFYGSSRFHADVPMILNRIQAGRMRIEGMVSHRVPLEELESAFNRLRNGDGARTILRF
ncbi:MAG: Zn-dependent alcohol dehydrogenase [Ktedonobacteraceae bacterium]|jgi:S-(hydroxymethyl)glutathione dehydrogenase / alcohol dehydrogenase